MKKLGHCSLCEKQVFEIASDGRVGAPLEGALRVALALMDGSVATITFCSGCGINPEAMPRIHRMMLESWANEGGADMTVAQIDNPPLGILYEESWQDAIAREASHGRTAR